MRKNDTILKHAFSCPGKISDKQHKLHLELEIKYLSLNGNPI